MLSPDTCNITSFIVREQQPYTVLRNAWRRMGLVTKWSQLTAPTADNGLYPRFQKLPQLSTHTTYNNMRFHTNLITVEFYFFLLCSSAFFANNDKNTSLLFHVTVVGFLRKKSLQLIDIVCYRYFRIY